MFRNADSVNALNKFTQGSGLNQSQVNVSRDQVLVTGSARMNGGLAVRTNRINDSQNNINNVFPMANFSSVFDDSSSNIGGGGGAGNSNPTRQVTSAMLADHGFAKLNADSSHIGKAESSTDVSYRYSHAHKAPVDSKSVVDTYNGKFAPTVKWRTDWTTKTDDVSINYHAPILPTSDGFRYGGGTFNF